MGLRLLMGFPGGGTKPGDPGVSRGLLGELPGDPRGSPGDDPGGNPPGM
jgi:hypothetical protein